MRTKHLADGIHAIVVGRSTSKHLPVTLAAVASGTRLPGTLTLVLLDDGEVDTTVLVHAGIAVSTVRCEAGTTGEAFHAGLGEGEWTWLLHDDSAPEADCLESLHRSCEASLAIAAAGPKQVGWDDPRTLLEVGIRATRSGRRVPELDPDEKDQGQFDSREDVLGVGTAGMLLRTSALIEAGGFDPALGPFGDGLELSRRLRAQGHRVVVVPAAIVRHARSSFSQTPESFGRRRRSQMYTALQRAPFLVAPFLFLLYVALSPARALARLAIKDTTRARGELWAGMSLLGQAAAILRARRRLRAATVTRSYRGLEATHRDVTESRSDIRKARREAERLRRLPPADERREAAERRARTRASAWLLAIITLAAGIIAVLPSMSAFGLTGGGLLPDDSSAGDLVAAATSSWVPAGDGHPGYLEPLWILAIPGVYVAELFGGSLTEVVFVFFLLSPMVSGLAAFRASGLVTNSPAVRFMVGALWASAAPLLSSLSAGEAGAVLFHIALPLLLASVARAATRRGSSHLGASAWWALVVGASYPASLLLIACAAIVLALIQRRVGWLWVPIPGMSLAAPALWWLAKSLPESFAWLPGATFSWDQGQRWEIVAGWPMGIEIAAPIVLAASVLVVLAAAIALARPRRRGAVMLGWGMVGIGGALVATALATTVGIDHRTFTTAVGWPGPGLSLIVGGLVLAAAGGAHGLRADLSSSTLSVRHVVAGVCAVGLVAAPLVSTAVWLTSIYTDSPRHVVSEAPGTRIPALAAKNAADPERGRTLVLTPGDDGYLVELWRGNGPQLTHQGHFAATGEALAQSVARLGEDDFAEILAEHAITVILVPGEDSAANDLATMLDSTDSITRVTTSEIGTFWRVDVPSGRVMLDGVVLPSGVVDATVDADEGVLYLSERFDPQWVAIQDGRELDPVEDSWRAAWEVPQAGTVHISHEGGFGQWWVSLGRLLIIAGNITVSLPWRAR